MAYTNSTIAGREGYGNFLARYLRGLAGDLVRMAQHIENNGVSRVVTAVAVVVIAAIILGVGSASIVATYTTGRLDERVTNGFCHINQRLDEIQRPAVQPRQCE